MTPVLTRRRVQVEPKCRGRRITPGRQHCRYGVAPRNMLGMFAESGATAPAPTMQGTAATSGVTTGTSFSVTMPGSIVAGETLICAVGGSRGAALGTTAMTGWTKALECSFTSGSSTGVLSIWFKVAVGGDTGTFSIGTGNTNMTAVVTRWQGVSTVSTGLTGNTDDTSGSVTMTANTVTTTVANSVVFTAVGGRATASGDVSPSSGGPTWGAGASALYQTASGRLGYLNLGSETKAATGAATHTAAIRNTQSPPVNCIGSIILAP